MRFVPGGPSIPDELLIARDRGDVVFFCGAGISQEYAHLPNFERLGRDVIERLGSGCDSPARLLLEKAVEAGHMAGVGGLLATDRVFGLLEREFEVSDVRNTVANAVKPPDVRGLDAHRMLLDLATNEAGVVRLVTTNFDLLFEDCDPSLTPRGPPHLPDPRSNREFTGIVHLHGRVDRDYAKPADDEFVISSADFGRAYLSDGWATRFIQSLLGRFQIVFVGYSADDPPVQYLLEALNLHRGSTPRLYAFQAGDSEAAAALWEHRGVRAISFDNTNGYAPLWDTLGAWAARARDVRGWYQGLLSQAEKGPAAQSPHIRGQVAHLVSTREGSRWLATSTSPIDGSWLLTFDANTRYAEPETAERYNDASKVIDPFDFLRTDFDVLPEPTDPTNSHDRRKTPPAAWDALAVTPSDRENAGDTGELRGRGSTRVAALSLRLNNLAIWLQRVAHQPVVLWWAARQDALHPILQRSIKSWIRQDPKRFSPEVRKGWHLLLRAWADVRDEPNSKRYEIEACVSQDGWSSSALRDYVAIYRPQLTVGPRWEIPHPLVWEAGEPPAALLSIDVDYPSPHAALTIPDSYLREAVALFRQNLELAISLEGEASGGEWLHFETTRAPDEGPELPDDSYGLTGPIVVMQKAMGRLGNVDPVSARAEVACWPENDERIFARLRIWAAAQKFMSGDDAARIVLSLSDQAFWGSLHERDLLYALRDRWTDLGDDHRGSLERRLLTGSFAWREDVRGGAARPAAHDRLSRITWLSGQSVKFGFDLAAVLSELKQLAPEWTPEVGAAVADSHAPEVYTIETNDDPARLEGLALSEILPTAEAAGKEGFYDRVQHAPFLGLSKSRPVRALGALTYVARQGQAPHWAWRAFLGNEARTRDPRRMIYVIIGRLLRFEPSEFNPLAYDVAEWTKAIAERLYGDVADVLPQIWNRLVKAIGELPAAERPRSGGWADVALNQPVGRLADVLMKDPSTNGLQPGAGLPLDWSKRAAQLLSLSGSLRRQSLAMIAYQVTWLFSKDPEWTKGHLLPAALDDGDDGDAFWDGAFWAARRPSAELFPLLKSAMIARTLKARSRRGHNGILAAFLLAGWLGEAGAAGNSQFLTSIELREVLIQTDDDLRGQFLWRVENLAGGEGGMWRDRIVPFLENVWPKQRALRTPELSARLADLALASGDLFPAVVSVVVPRLTPAKDRIRSIVLSDRADDHPAYAYPAALLDLLWAILAEDSREWPYKIGDAIERLSEDPVTTGDSRLAELRRRRERWA